MPLNALANWNWGGRLHPLYYNLSIATKSLLGLVIMICRLVVSVANDGTLLYISNKSFLH